MDGKSNLLQFQVTYGALCIFFINWGSTFPLRFIYRLFQFIQFFITWLQFLMSYNGMPLYIHCTKSHFLTCPQIIMKSYVTRSYKFTIGFLLLWCVTFKVHHFHHILVSCTQIKEKLCVNFENNRTPFNKGHGQMGYSQPLQNLYECIPQRKLGFIG